MQYQNPFNLSSINIQGDIVAALQEVKEDLKVRLHNNISEEDTVTIRNVQLTKGEWLFWFKQLASAETRHLHLRIAENRDLANFLEFGHLGFLQKLQMQDNAAPAETLYQAIQTFLQHDQMRPFFVAQYAQSLLQAFKTHHEEDMILLQAFPIELTDEEIGLYFEELQQYLSQTTQEIKTLIENQSLSYISERELVSHLSDKKIQLLNQLPSPLARERDYVGTTIGHLATYMTMQLGYREAAEALLRQALKLKLSEQLRHDLEELLKMVKPRIFANMPSWLFIGLGVTALLFLINYLEKIFIG